MPHPAIARTLLTLAATGLAAACGGDDVTAPAVIQTVELDIGTCSAVQEGQTCELELTVMDSQGELVEDPRLQWQSDQIVFATVSADGVVTALREGTVTIRVSTLSGTIFDEITLLIRAAAGGGGGGGGPQL